MPDYKHLLPPHREEKKGGQKAAEPALEQVIKKQQEAERKKTEQPPEHSKKVFRNLLFVLAGILILAGLGTGFLFLRKHRSVSREKQRLARQQGQGPKVLVAKVTLPPPERTVTLPGDVRAFNDVGVFPRVSGYVKEIRVDKGDKVKKGDLLAVVESPETDQQVAAAHSALRLKAILAARARRLAPSGTISRSELDNAVEGERSAKADYRRTLALQDYEKVRASYDGVITARNFDPGALVSATSALFELADPSKLRVWIYVAQDISPYVRAGDAVELTQDERPGVVVKTQVSRIADALDPRTRTMLAEVWLENTQTPLAPGIFVHATLHVKVPPLPVVPSNAILSRGDQTMVAVVNDNKLHLVKIESGLDDGKMTQIRQGLKGGETVALDVPSEIGDGAVIQAVTQEQQKKNSTPQARSGPNPPRQSE
jgi:membrane fusion protein (multidrug efflux system)